MPKPRREFDRAYYERFYEDPSTRVTETSDTEKLARFVIAYLDYLGVSVTSALDLGCGIGRWKTALHKVCPQASYTGVEISEAMCEDYGWQRGSVVDWKGGPADLVVCHGVLQYLSDADARAAIDNLGRLAKTALYLEVVTKEDWESNVNQALTDGEIHLRRAKWYRRHLAKHFESAGGGIYLPLRSKVVLYELERGA